MKSSATSTPPASTPGTSPPCRRSSNVVAAEVRAGDLVVVMSNGGFDGIHDKLLDALGARSTVR